MVNLVTTDDRPEVMREYTAFLLGRFPEITTVVNNITDRMSMVAQGESENVYYGPGTIREKLGRFSYRISAKSFFQTNTLQAEVLFDAVVRLAEFAPADVVYDLYCGTGAIAVFISAHVGQVVGIEVSESAVADAYNAADNGDELPLIRATLPGARPRFGLAGVQKPTVVVVDPPNSLHEN